MFPGQGSQAVGMGCDLAAQEPVMRQTYDEASAVLGYDLMELCSTGPVEDLGRTDRTQPALLANSIGILRVLMCYSLHRRGLGKFPQFKPKQTLAEE